MKTKFLFPAVFLLALASANASEQANFGIYEFTVPPAQTGELDRIVQAKLATLGFRPSLCTDAVFVRRAYLDVIGTLPTPQEAREFIQDSDTWGKRAKLVDKLLARDEFSDYWAMKWGDALKIKAEFPVNLWPNAAQAYHHWVKASIAENKPYDKFARELLTSSGSNFRVGPVNFYRAVQNRTPEGIAGAVALTLMGSRVDSWPKERLAGMAVFFSQIGYKSTREWKEENVFWDPLHSSVLVANAAAEKKPGAAPAEPAPLVEPGVISALLPDGTKMMLTPDRDPREDFADWLIKPKNPWFTRAICNRVWSWLLGRGIIHEPDDIRDDNPPCNPQLLAYLEKELIASGYDMKKFYRLILTSGIYQSSSVPRFGDNPKAEANFASYPLRRLEAEVLIDAINKATGATDLYTSPIPEPFTYIPKDKPAITIADGSITSPFLTLFGRSARATGMMNERNNKPIPAQWLHMLNSSHIQQKISQGPTTKAIIDSGKRPGQILEDLYLTILSRFPTPQEVSVAEAYSSAAPAVQGKAGNNNRGGTQTKRREDWIDIAWALINSDEFLYRH